jgi:hypothetical protein
MGMASQCLPLRTKELKKNNPAFSIMGFAKVEEEARKQRLNRASPRRGLIGEETLG